MSFLDQFSTVVTEEEFFQQQIAVQITKEQRLQEIVSATKRVDSVIECPRCKSHRVQYREAQTRSADEGMTCICKCTVCQHKFSLKS